MFSIRACGSTANLKVAATSATRFSAAFSSSSTPAFTGSFASTMFSVTVITGISMKCWCTIPIPSSIASLGDEIVTGFPFIRISPESAV